MVVKIVKDTKKCVIKKIKFENYENCLEATQLDNKIKYIDRNKINIDSFEEFIRNNKSILKTQQRFKIEINKIALSSNDDKRMQSID